MSYWHALAALIVAATLLERWFAARPTGPGSAARLRTNLGVFGLDAALAVVLAPMSAALILGLRARPRAAVRCRRRAPGRSHSA